MSPDTFTQYEAEERPARISGPVLSPAVVDFGIMTCGETKTRTLIYNETIEAEAEIRVSLSKGPLCFHVIRCEQIPSGQSSQLRFTIAANTTNLMPGQRYDSWLFVHGKKADSKAQLVLHVAEASTSTNAPRWRGQNRVKLLLLAILVLIILAASASGVIRTAFMPWRSFAASDRVVSMAAAEPLSDEELVFTVEEGRQRVLNFANPRVRSSQRSLDVPGWSPTWSPDGSLVAFISDSDGSEQVYMLNAQTGFIYQLSESSGFKLSPKWSPDGLRLAFIAGKPNQGMLQIVSVPNAYVESLTEVERTNIADETDQIAQVVQAVYKKPDQARGIVGYSRHFDWSPDGLSILFDLHDGDKQRVYTATSNSLQMLIDSDIWSTPVWSPDGKQILAASNIGVYVMDAHGENPRKLNAMQASSPRWSLDGRKIAFLTEAGAGQALWVMDADGRNPMEVVGADVVDYTWSTENDTWAYITGSMDSKTLTLYLWIAQIETPPQLVAEVSDPTISWRTTAP